MFGEYAMYAHEVVVGLVCDQTVFIKVTEGTSALLTGRVGTGQPYPGAKPWFMLTEDELMDEVLISQVIAAALRDLPVTRKKARSPKQPSKSKRASKSKAAARDTVKVSAGKAKRRGSDTPRAQRS